MNNLRTVPSLLIAFCTLGLTFAAGNASAESASDTRADVSDTSAEGRENVAEERRDASEDLNDAQEDVDEANADFRKESDKGARDIALAQAEASHKTSIKKCGAMTDDLRKACKDAADSDLKRAKAELK